MLTSPKRRPKPRPDERSATTRFGPGLTVGLLLLAVAVLLILALLLPGGVVGLDLRRQLGREFGWGSYLVPVVLGAFAVGCLRPRLDPNFRLGRLEIVGWLMVFLTCDSLLQIVGSGFPVGAGELSSGGGMLGQTSWQLLIQAFGKPSALLVVFIVGVAGLTFLFNVTVADAWYLLRLAAIQLWRGIRQLPRLLVAILGGLARLLAQAAHRFRHDREAALADDVELAVQFSPVEFAPESTNLDEDVDSGEPTEAPEWQLPPITLLKAGIVGEPSQADLQKKIKLIEDTLADFDVFAKVVQVNPGPTVTQFGLEPGFRERRDRNGNVVKREKIKVSEITTLSNDLALALAAPSIRIEAPVPGRQVVGLEVPNGLATVVSLRQIVESTAFQKVRQKTKLAVALGEDVSGQPVAADLAKMPHLLIAGATGSGKSVCVNAIISCLLLQATPEEVRLILVDPKRVELTTYNEVPHLLRPVVVDVDKVVGVLKWVVHEMDERYKLFETHGVRNVESYNKLANAREELNLLPSIVVVIDELADLMMLAPDETERLICRLAQLARATGIHLIVATQRPSVDVITGLIKANFPTRISFAVTSQIDSRTILDATGAEKLLGRGDMLYMPTDAAKPIRLQGVYVSDEEIDGVTAHWRALGPTNYVEQLLRPAGGDGDDEGETDDLYEKAVEVAHEHTRISTSLLQRRLRIGYTRAARLVDLLEDKGIVGPAEGGGRSREVHYEERAPEIIS